MPLKSILLGQLEISPLNVRTNEEDANAVDALAASILAKGLLFPLVVHPPFEDMPAGKFFVLAGGRRLRALRKLAGDGALGPAQRKIECVVRDVPPAEITELSLSENLLRRELRPYEVHAAIARAREQGASPEDIAEHTGQTLAFVHRQLRLGNLAPGIFAAYADGKLSSEQAQAYAATEDHALQLQAFEHFTAGLSYRHNPADIRAFLKVGDRELARLLRFVGDKAYREAGGRFELDLFADGPEELREHRGRVVDEELLRQLVDLQLSARRGRLREQMGDALSFAAQPPQFSGYTDSSLELEEKEAARILARDPAAEIVATLAIDDAGRVEPKFWWVSRKAKGAAQKSGQAKANTLQPKAAEAIGAHSGDRYAQEARAQVKDEHGFTADGLQLVRWLRRALLRAVLATNARAGDDLGRDYLVWSGLRAELVGVRTSDTGARGLATLWASGDEERIDFVDDYLATTMAEEAWRREIDFVMRSPWLTEEDAGASLEAFVDLPEDRKRHAGAVLAGLALLRSANTPGFRLAAHDKLAELAGASDPQLRRYWTPDAAFVGLLPKLKRLELAQPHVDPDAFAGWHKASDKVLTGAVAGALEQAEGWVHPLLSFNVPDERPAVAIEEAAKMPMPA